MIGDCRAEESIRVCDKKVGMVREPLVNQK
jgi:hypothetical protein